MLDQLKAFARKLKQELALYQLLAKHPETPYLAKCFFGLAVAYLLLPFDLIPDFIPVLGQLDDLVVIPLCVYIALRLTPEHLIIACRQQIK